MFYNLGVRKTLIAAPTRHSFIYDIPGIIMFISLLGKKAQAIFVGAPDQIPDPYCGGYLVLPLNQRETDRKHIIAFPARMVPFPGGELVG